MTLGDFFREGDEDIVDYADEADADSDLASMTLLAVGPDDRFDEKDEVVGALVLIKGEAAVAAFRAWAHEAGLITPGKEIRDTGPGRN